MVQETSGLLALSEQKTVKTQVNKSHMLFKSNMLSSVTNQ